MRKFFITGGSGFYGINIIRKILEHGDEVVSYDLLPFDYPEANKIKWVVGDIRNFDDLKKAL
jgi:nucleoside-diphosphate-sugar epimerase